MVRYFNYVLLEQFIKNVYHSLEYNRSWESARNRFLRTLFKNLSLYHLDKEIISNFKRGAVAESELEYL